MQIYFHIYFFDIAVCVNTNIASEVVARIRAHFPFRQRCRSYGFDARQPGCWCTLSHHSGLNNSELFVNSSVVQKGRVTSREIRELAVVLSCRGPFGHSQNPRLTFSVCAVDEGIPLRRCLQLSKNTSWLIGREVGGRSPSSFQLRLFFGHNFWSLTFPLLSHKSLCWPTMS